MATLPLHNQFDIIKLKLYLKQHPEQAKTIAITQFTYYLEMLTENERLETENKKLKSVSLPPFGTPSHGKLQRQYDELLECYTELLGKFRNLGEENKALYQLLQEENPELPHSLKRRQKP